MIYRLGLSGKNSIEAYNFQGITRSLHTHNMEENKSISKYKSAQFKEDSSKLLIIFQTSSFQQTNHIPA